MMKRHPLALLLIPIATLALLGVPACSLPESGEETGDTGDDTGTDDTGDDTGTDDTGTDDTGTDDTGTDDTGTDDTGDDTSHAAGTPEPVLTMLGLERDVTCGISSTGAGYCWGANNGKKLGAGPGSAFSFLEPNEIVDGHSWAAFGFGVEHGCGLDTAGAAWCWSGELGHGESTVSPSPVAVAGDHSFVDLDVFDHYGCGLDGDGQVWCWGDNKNGQFGDGTTEGSLEPVAGGANLTIADLDLGRRYGCGVTTTSELHCWGDSYGADTQLGADRSWSSVSAGESSLCAIDSEGAAWCIGGITDTGSDALEEVAGGHTWAMISHQISHVCGLDTAGTAWCWGSNFKGQLGNPDHGRDFDKVEPFAVTGGHTFANIAAGNRHTCGTTTDGDLYCWGYNEFGELGNGEVSLGATTEPQLVLGGLTWALP